MSAELVKALLVTAEITGTDLSEGAALVIAEELSGLDRDHVMGALKRCRRELKGRLTLASIMERLEDGRPGPDEAFAMLPLSEEQTVVWTDEIAQASAVAMPLLDAGDKHGARLAFREVYADLVNKAREQRRPVNWWATLGHDRNGRESVLMRAVKEGKISLEYASEAFPMICGPSSEVALALARSAVRRA